jgi:hypothetical protein
MRAAAITALALMLATPAHAAPKPKALPTEAVAPTMEEYGGEAMKRPIDRCSGVHAQYYKGCMRYWKKQKELPR